MVVQMKCRWLLVGFLGLCLAAPVRANEFEDYRRDLTERCPAKHLDLLSPGDLADYLDAFTASLPAAERARFEKTADIEHACEEVEAGASCQNFAQIRAARTLKLMAKLIESLCDRPLACTAQSECGHQP